MTNTRTAALTLMAGAFTTLVLAGSGGTASAKPIWCEPAVPHACHRWTGHATPVVDQTARPAGISQTQYLKLLSVR